MNPNQDSGDSIQSLGVTKMSDVSPGSSKASSTSEINSSSKKAAAKKLIEQYYRQLTSGCGNADCRNANCNSSGTVPTMSPDKAAAQALKLFFEQAKLCNNNSTKLGKPFEAVGHVPMDLIDQDLIPGSCNDHILGIGTSNVMSGSNSDKSSKAKAEVKSPCFMTESSLLDVLEKCKAENSYSLLVRTIGKIYSNVDSLNLSFRLEKNAGDDLIKEEIREIEGEKDKDEDSCMDISDTSQQGQPVLKSDEITLDFCSLRRTYRQLFDVEDHPFQSALINALLIACETAEIDLKYHKCYERDPNYLNMFFIICELPCLQNVELQELAIPAFCKAMAQLPICAQAKFARVFSKNCSSEHLKTLIDALHQLITIKIYTQRFDRDYFINDEESIISATKVLKIFYYASVVGGENDKDSIIPEEPEVIPVDDFFQDPRDPKDREISRRIAYQPDLLATELNAKVMDCRKPMVNFEEFYHEPLSDQLEMDRDFMFYKSDLDSRNEEGGSSNKFAFMNYPFILTPATKALGLYYDNRTRMFSERRMSVLQSIRGAPSSPFLKLKVRRDHLIDDALVELEMVAMESPSSLKKQLVVEFEGEQGIDEGGVSKEFFQLVVEEIFNPDFGMFTTNPDVQLYWFNPTSFESDAQFTLIGIVIGLAIYNNVILDIHFPMVVYRKLLGKQGSFDDLVELNPSLYNGLLELVNYKGEDIENVFMQTYQVGYHDVFGSYTTHDLKPNGSEIMVNQYNKHEFVSLYADYLLNKSVAKQFHAFKRGFQMVTEESPLKMLFRPEEVELLVCGSKHFNFSDLEEATDYDGGYTHETPIIKSFWEIVHDFNEEQKRKLLQFCTGSDRVPVGGLSKLKMIIARHGPESDRLPTAHTCFNVLLLPEYSSKEKLSTALLKAIMYSQGFGML